MSWAPAFCSPHLPPAIVHEHLDGGIGRAGLGRLRGLWWAQRIRGREARPASSQKPRLHPCPSPPSLSSLTQEGGPGDPSLLLPLAESSQNCAQPEGHGPQATGSWPKSKASEVCGDTDEQGGPVAAWPGLWLCVGFLMWRPAVLEGGLGTMEDAHQTCCLRALGSWVSIGFLTRSPHLCESSLHNTNGIGPFGG